MDRFNSFCISSYLAFRYVATADVPWKPGFCPAFPIIPEGRKVGVTSADEILASLRSIMAERVNDATGILLSGGIDSAILAALLPPSRKAFTIRFVADGAVDESIRAGEYAKLAGLEHHVVDVTWSDYQAYSDLLMRNKKSPLHAVEVGLYKTGLIAQSHGVTRLVLGNGADSTFGGLDKLLSRDWTFEDFIKRYAFIASKLLARCFSISPFASAFLYASATSSALMYTSVCSSFGRSRSSGAVNAANSAPRLPVINTFRMLLLCKTSRA